jgi:hypothetical protein
MALKLNDAAFEFAKDRIASGEYVIDERDAWSEHQPTTEEENQLIEDKGWGAYAKWHLGIDDAENEQTKARYKFPYGDFEAVHRCAVLAAESRAGQRKYEDIEFAAAHLHGMLDAVKAKVR